MSIDSRGFSLLEALIASLLVTIAVAAVAQLMTVAATQTFGTRQLVAALVLAQAKLEELRSIEWRFDAVGARISGAALAFSPSTALAEDVAGYVETVDRFGQPSGPDTAHFKRRWAIGPLQISDPDTLLLRVCVFAIGRDVAGGRPDACVWAVRTRKR